MRALLDRFEFEQPEGGLDLPRSSADPRRRSPRDDGQLAALAGGSLAAQFRHWRGASGRRYVFSVYDRASCPAYDHAVLIAVGREPSGRRQIAFIADTGALPEIVLARAARAAGEGALELQVHLLAASPAERAEVVADLSANADYFRLS